MINMINMLTLRGSHGTTVSRAKKIRQQGFKIFRQGGFLTGIYFWRHGRFADDLSEGWWRMRFGRGEFQNDGDTRFAVIHAILSVDEDSYLDMESFEVKEEMWNLAEETGLKDVKDRAKLYDKFIEIMERGKKIKVKVAELRVSLPNGHFDCYPMKILGPPFCYAARDVACIQVLEE
jgi:hypothetical protein